MSPNPLSESYLGKVAGAAVTLLAAAVLWLLLVIYGGVNMLAAFIIGATYTFLLALAGYIYWFVIDYLQMFLAKVTAILAIQFLSLSGTFALYALLMIDEPAMFRSVFPLCLIYGLLCFIALVQWYRIVLDKRQMLQMEESFRKEPASSEAEEIIDKISVKEGAQIHIVRLEELLCIQAYGDYVMLITENGRHIKEQTMKYFEIHLPATFVRIHRSCIVNSEKIARVELFGKESYNVYLKNGSSLRASTAGYKLLKEKMLL